MSVWLLWSLSDWYWGHQVKG